jgi:bacterioferritin (cytochrome b1)
MVWELGSSVEGSKDPTTQTNTSKSTEEVITKIMKVNKATELFQTMVIVSLNMGNLTLEVNALKNRLAMGAKEKAMLQEELNKERDFLKGYKHNVEIWRKNRVEAKQKNKMLIKKLQDENEELKGSIT